MESLKELYRIGTGPSSSHTLGPQAIAKHVKKKYPSASFYDVTLYGSLSLTGKGHLTDYIIEETLGKDKTKVHFSSDSLPFHPNALDILVYQGDDVLKKVRAYSVGGGEVVYEDEKDNHPQQIYPQKSFKEVLKFCEKNGISLYDYVLTYEEDGFETYLYKVLDQMFQTIKNGLSNEGLIPGELKIKRVAKNMYQHAINTHNESQRDRLLISSYAYATSEENACGNVMVTAPTCGASGVVPAILYYGYRQLQMERKDLIKALAVAGVIGNVIKTNATISGADGGCQAEIGTACAMAAGACGYMFELNNNLIAYASEMGLEHNLGLTCDPVGGYVQIPCIERNGFAALRAMDCAMYAKQLGYLRDNKVSFDTVVKVMNETGHDLNQAYKETSLGGLAKEFGVDDD